MLNTVKSRFLSGKMLIKFIVLSLILNSSFLINNCVSQWQPDVRLTNNSAASFTSWNNAWNVASNGNIVHVVWYDNRDGNYEIYYKQSTDAGINWGIDVRLTNATADSYHPSVAVSGTVVNVVWRDYRDGNSEIYYKRNPTGNPIGIINTSSEIPSSYSLQQNYPNPFNPTTRICFEVPIFPLSKGGQRGLFTALRIYDINGREVATLVNEQLAPGIYSVDWNASDFPSGIYFYRLQTNGYIETKKMLLTK